MIKVNYGDKAKLWTVEGSTGKRYMVRFDPDLKGGKWECFCIGFKRRHKCKHIKEKQTELLREQGYAGYEIHEYLSQWWG